MVINIRTRETFDIFKLPFLIVGGIVGYLILNSIPNFSLLADGEILLIILIGSFELIKETVSSILNRKFALDYIALLAITVGIVDGQYLVAAIIVLMLSGGTTLEKYGMSLAKKSLTALTDRIPNSVYLWENKHIGKKAELPSVSIGEEVAVRKGEVIPLDGILESANGLTDESSLTGEPNSIEKLKGDIIRSGTVNIGDILVIKVTATDKNSTYRKIIEMVQEAQKEKAPLIRLADRYSTIFTLITFFLASCAYFISHDFGRVLSVLVIATPCPLILATPIALMGGMNSAAKKRIIIKRLGGLEVLSKVNTIIFDKTGTITLGRPVISRIISRNSLYTEKDIISIAAAIERNSLHPLAKAIVSVSKENMYELKNAKDIIEEIGVGISAIVENIHYSLSKIQNYKKMAIQIKKGNQQIAILEFEDKIKKDSKEIIKELGSLGLKLYIFTGDKKEAAEEVVKQLGEHVIVKAGLSPEDKKKGIEKLKSQYKVTAMVGDGINDAPALALADVGMVFSNEEQTAASEAADIVFLGGDLASVTQVISIGKNTIRIAMQSIVFGIGLSTIGMIFAVFGFIPAVLGAFIQETIDVAVIFNALRTSRVSK